MQSTSARRGSDTPIDGLHQRSAYTITISADTGPFSFGATPGDNDSDVAHPEPRPVSRDQSYRRPAMTARRTTHEVNNAAWAYTKCAILFFTALLITWIPSSANRVYSLVHNESSLPPLELMSAFVLPLQGWWNAVVYVVTSWGACKGLVDDLRWGRRPTVSDLVGGMKQRKATAEEGGIQLSQFKTANNQGSKSFLETESMTELAHARENMRDHSDDESQQERR